MKALVNGAVALEEVCARAGNLCPLPLKAPSDPPIPALWVITQQRTKLPVLHSSSPLASCLIWGVYVCQWYSLDSSPSPSPTKFTSPLSKSVCSFPALQINHTLSPLGKLTIWSNLVKRQSCYLQIHFCFTV